MAEKCRALKPYDHEGEKYEQIGLAIADDLCLPHFRVRARMIQMGHAKIVALSNAAVKGEEIPQEEQISVTDAMDVMMVSFDEQLFIRTVEQITVFPDKLVFVFKDGTEIPIDE